jgi:aldose 1-epimerase
MKMVTACPTGEQVEIRYGDQSATVVQVGGGLRSYDVSGRAVLDGYSADARIDGGRGQVLAPWPNRIRDGRYSWDGGAQQLPITEVPAGNAIHGLVRWLPWSLLERSESAATMGVRLWPQPGYPFHLTLSTTYTLDDAGLSVALEGRSVGTEPLPYGVGQHPYVTVGTEFVDDAVLTVPAATALRLDDRGLPAGTEAVAGSALDFRAGRRIGDAHLDVPFTDLTLDDRGRVAARLERADAQHGVEVWAAEGTSVLQVYTGDQLNPARRRRGLAVEPMSCPPDAFNSGAGLVTLQPGESHLLRWGIRAW